MVVLHVAMSLDGFIAGPGHDMSWTAGAEFDTSSQLADEVARSTGVVLAGRGWYEVASADEGGAVAGIYGGAWSGPVLVLTHHPEQLASDRAVEAVSDLVTALARAEELAGDRAVSIFGADVARQVLALGRLDEIIVQIVPIVLGTGCGCSARRRLLASGSSARTSVRAGRSPTYASEWPGRQASSGSISSPTASTHSATSRIPRGSPLRDSGTTSMCPPRRRIRAGNRERSEKKGLVEICTAGTGVRALTVFTASAVPHCRGRGACGESTTAAGLGRAPSAKLLAERIAMAFTIRSVEYYYVNVRDDLGAAYSVLSQLAELGVNLLAFTAVPSGPSLAQFTLLPEDPDKLVAPGAQRRACARRYVPRLAHPGRR
jgi:dihydrofolate reductase